MTNISITYTRENVLCCILFRFFFLTSHCLERLKLNPINHLPTNLHHPPNVAKFAEPDKENVHSSFTLFCFRETGNFRESIET